MTLPASGRLRISDIATEFGGANPHKLSEYIRGGSYVPSSSQASIKTSAAQMAFSQYRGAAKAVIAAFPALGGVLYYRYTAPSTFTPSTITAYITAGTFLIGASGNAGEGNSRISGIRVTPVASRAAGKYSFDFSVIATESSPGGSFSINVDNSTAAYNVYRGNWLSRSWYGTDYLVAIDFISFSTVSKKLVLDLTYSTSSSYPTDYTDPETGAVVPAVKGVLRAEIPFE